MERPSVAAARRIARPRSESVAMIVRWIRRYGRTADPRLLAARLLSLVAAAIGLAWISIGFWLQSWLVLIQALVVVIASFGATVLVIMGFRLAGRLLWFASISLVILAGHLFIHSAANVDQLYAGVVAAIFLNFSVRRERGMIVLVHLIVLGCWGTGLIADHLLTLPELIGHDLAEQVISPLVTATTVISVAANVAVFVLLTERYHARLLAARAEAEAANRAKSSFLASVSHEIRTPMNGVIGMAELLAASRLTDTQRENLDVILASSTALLRIINEILDMSAIESGRLTLLDETFPLTETLESAVETLRAYADANHVQVDLLLPPGLPAMVRGDAGRLRQVIINVLGNGIKFSRRPVDDVMGHAALEVSQTEAGALRLRFTDDGIGIAEEFLPDLFQPFRRANAATTQKFGGTGLGLAIVRELAERMGGTITVESRPGEGTQIDILLPLPVVQPAPGGQALAGRHLVLVGLAPAQRRFWHCLTRGQDLRLSELEESVTAEVLTRHLSDDAATEAGEPTFVVPMFDDFGNETRRLCDLLRQVAPTAPLILLSTSRERASGLRDRRTFLLQASPCLPQAAVAAVLALGRPVSAMPRPRRRAGVAPSATPSLAATATPVPAADPPAAAMAPAHILVVEDNEINQIVISSQLERLGHRVDLAANGLEGLARWRSERYDLVLTDCHMPEMDGYELAMALRAEELHSRRPRLPIIAVTANAAEMERNRCHEAGIDGVLTKPATFAALREMLARFLPAGGQAVSSPLSS